MVFFFFFICDTTRERFIMLSPGFVLDERFVLDEIIAMLSDHDPTGNTIQIELLKHFLGI